MDAAHAAGLTRRTDQMRPDKGMKRRLVWPEGHGISYGMPSELHKGLPP